MHRSSSSTIAFIEGELWVTSPDDDAIVRIDPATLEEAERIEVAGSPQHLLGAEGIWVSLAQRSAVAHYIDGELEIHEIPCRSSLGLALNADGELLIACPHDNRVVQLSGSSIRAVHSVEGEPSEVAVSGSKALVSLRRAGAVVALGEAPEPLESDVGLAASQLGGLSVGPAGELAAIYQRVDHDSNRDRPAESGGYGSLIDGEPRIAPMLTGSCEGAYASFNGGPFVFSGPSATLNQGDRVWVAHQYTDNVALLRCDSGAPRAIASYRVGRGPRGLALAPPDSTHAGDVFVDLGFDHAVARLDADASGELRDAALTLRRELGETDLSADALRGRALFADAVNTHLTPSGVVTCATCHPGGGEDGLVWFLHTEGIPRKLRRTPPAWGARPDLAPFHWDGEFTEATVLTRTTIIELMNGDGLLVDLAAIEAYMAELKPPPSYEEDPQLARRGLDVFEAAGCQSCHIDGTGTDGLRHQVVDDATDSDARMDSVDTPSLRAIRSRAPLLHDGRAASLRDVLTIHNESNLHGQTADLSDAELDQLVAYLHTL